MDYGWFYIDFGVNHTGYGQKFGIGRTGGGHKVEVGRLSGLHAGTVDRHLTYGFYVALQTEVARFNKALARRLGQVDIGQEQPHCYGRGGIYSHFAGKHCRIAVFHPQERCCSCIAYLKCPRRVEQSFKALFYDNVAAVVVGTEADFELDVYCRFGAFEAYKFAGYIVFLDFNLGGSSVDIYCHASIAEEAKLIEGCFSGTAFKAVESNFFNFHCGRFRLTGLDQHIVAFGQTVLPGFYTFDTTGFVKVKNLRQCIWFGITCGKCESLTTNLHCHIDVFAQVVIFIDA